MELLYKTLKWPVISLLITGGFHFTIEAIWPDLKATFIPAVLAPLLLVYGLWVGYRAIQFGGQVLDVLEQAFALVGQREARAVARKRLRNRPGDGPLVGDPKDDSEFSCQ